MKPSAQTPNAQDWRPLKGEGDFALEEGEAHVWRFSLDPGKAWLERTRSWLTEAERKRADRFIRAEHGQRFTAGRAVLRYLLGRYTGQDPGAVSIAVTKQGKPFLEPPNQRARIQFNLSHSADLALLAVTGRRTVGVDVEKIRGRGSLMAIARRYFAAAEYQALEDLPEPGRLDAFYRCWTRKEAYLKAKGGGLHLPLNGFEVSLHSNAPSLNKALDGEAELQRWTLCDPPEVEEFASALVLERPHDEVQWLALRDPPGESLLES